jgi:hypothetical protein
MMLCIFRVLTEDRWLLVNIAYETLGLHSLLLNYLQKYKTYTEKM